MTLSSRPDLPEKTSKQESDVSMRQYRPYIMYLLSRLTVCPSVASRNLLLYQSLPSSIPYRHTIWWRRKDGTGVGTTARGVVGRLHRVPRCLQPHDRPSGRVRRALSTGTGDRGRSAQPAPLSPRAALSPAQE